MTLDEIRAELSIRIYNLQSQINALEDLREAIDTLINERDTWG